jgi:hypothetical protein
MRRATETQGPHRKPPHRRMHGSHSPRRQQSPVCHCQLQLHLATPTDPDITGMRTGGIETKCNGSDTFQVGLRGCRPARMSACEDAGDGTADHGFRGRDLPYYCVRSPRGTGNGGRDAVFPTTLVSRDVTWSRPALIITRLGRSICVLYLPKGGVPGSRERRLGPGTQSGSGRLGPLSVPCDCVYQFMRGAVQQPA